MTTNVEVQKTGTENGASVLRRFTRKVQGSGVLPKVRSIRYKKRDMSAYTRKKRALKSISRKAEIEVLIKLGKFVEKQRRGRRK